ncbi:MAG: c-type cytochrome, partial [Limisphaerales bacterium]
AALLSLLVIASAGAAVSPTLELPARGIISRGVNEWDGEVLKITKGRGATLGWFIAAKQAEEVTVSIEYTCPKPLNQEYHVSFDGQIRFWTVPVTEGTNWSRAKLGEFTVRPGLPLLVLLVPPSNRKYDHALRFHRLILESRTPGNLTLAKPPEPPVRPDAAPGFGKKLNARHPALEATDLRGETHWRISGMALRGPRELLFTTWEGDLMALDLEAATSNGKPPFKRIARGLSEPMGLAIADGRIFVTEKNQVTELIDANEDGAFETYRCISHDWPATIDYHEYLFGALVHDSHLYFANSVAMAIRNTHNQQAYLRGSVIKVHIDTGKTEVVAGGLRSANGIGFGPGKSILLTDNQGEWLPGNKLVHLQPKAFYEFRSRAPWHPYDRLVSTPPAVWLPHTEIAMSPTEPSLLPKTWGPYAGQVIYGDVTFGGLQRVFLEEVEGVMQGAAIPFSQGFRHLFNRLVFTPAGELYAGGIARGNNQEFIKDVSGLTRIRFTGKKVFEPLAARLHSNGIELEFTEALAPGAGWNPAGYYVTQWGYQATQSYGGKKVRHRRSEVRSATVSDDRRRVFLELPDLVENEILRFRLPQTLKSASGRSLWVGELWYTVNRIPKNHPGDILPAPKDALVAESFFRFTGNDTGSTLYQNYCAPCHTLDGSKRIGPSFRGLAGSTRPALDPAGRKHQLKVDADYLRQSIIEPGALVVEGYENIMPPMAGLLRDSQIDALVNYLLKIK